MQRRRLFVAGIAALALTGLAPARAASVGIGVYDFNFSPTVAEAVDGDTVTWTWTCTYGSCPGTHNITAWQGASFSSGNLAYPASYTVTMPAATVVRYRCTIHSALSGSNCNGMCGALTADGLPPGGAVTDPTENEIHGFGLTVPVAFGGTASDDTGVAYAKLRIYDLLGIAQEYPVTLNPPAPTTLAAWNTTVNLRAGSYLVEIEVTDWVGNRATSPRVRFFVV